MIILRARKLYIWLLFIGNIIPMALLASSPEPIYFYASQSGETTLDQGEGGGNPFASALVDLLASDKLSFANFQSKIISLTEEKSKGYQTPEVTTSNADLDKWQFLPLPSDEKRIALILVFSDYETSGISSLPGAKNDLYRVSKALSKADFEIQTIIDPDKSSFESILKKFSEKSKTYDTSVIYTTGHGVEVNGITYLLPSNYSLIDGKNKLSSDAIRIKEFGEALKASKANLVFYGGCRNNPFVD